MIRLQRAVSRSVSAFLIAIAGLIFVQPQSSAETWEATCNFTTVWYDSRLTLASVIEEGGGACFFDVAMPSDAGDNERPAAEVAKRVQAAALAPAAEQAALLQETRQPLLDTLEFPLLKDKRFASIGGVKLHNLIEENYDEIITCTQAAFAGNPYSAQTPEGMKVGCGVGGGNKTYTLAISYASLTVEVRIPLA